MKSLLYPKIDMLATGKNIKEIRMKKGIKISELMQYMGFNEPQAIYKWQRGECLPTVENLFALSKILGISMEDILVENDEMSSCILNILCQLNRVTVLRRENAYV
ncbi:helix-turn-helix domain-containing protein [Anaerosporobacter sp.]|uniref:helix-turn-helix domain-containing protein n=1 Tax=Anaerosporobacter sp. TaxID=1872529 RepID=UPI00286F26B3|nr:helix-turn-helix transcriptional regulator [Anaerosporobacter sp.]